MSKYKDLLEKYEELDEKLRQITQPTITTKKTDYLNTYLNTWAFHDYDNLPTKEVTEVTLLGRIEAIEKHLGIEVKYRQPATVSGEIVIKIIDAPVEKRKYTKLPISKRTGKPVRKYTKKAKQ